MAPTVRWELPVGCDFSGFFVETVTLLPELLRRTEGTMQYKVGECSDETLDALPAEERTALLRAQANAVHGKPLLWRTHVALIQHGAPAAPLARERHRVCDTPRRAARCAAPSRVGARAHT